MAMLAAGPCSYFTGAAEENQPGTRGAPQTPGQGRPVSSGLHPPAMTALSHPAAASAPRRTPHRSPHGTKAPQAGQQSRQSCFREGPVSSCTGLFVFNKILGTHNLSRMALQSTTKNTPEPITQPKKSVQPLLTIILSVPPGRKRAAVITGTMAERRGTD